MKEADMRRTDERDSAYLLMKIHGVPKVASTKESKNMPSKCGSLSSESTDAHLSSRTLPRALRQRAAVQQLVRWQRRWG